MHKNNLGIMDTCSWATPTVEEEVEPPTPEETPIKAEGTYLLDTSVQEGTYHSYHHGCLQRAEGMSLLCMMLCREQVPSMCGSSLLVIPTTYDALERPCMHQTHQWLTAASAGVVEEGSPA